MRAYVLTYKGERLEAKPKRGEDGRERETFPLEQMQDIVGGYIEVVGLTDEVLMVVNEEGKLNNLPLNKEATKLFWRCFPESPDYIVGNVLVCESSMIE